MAKKSAGLSKEEVGRKYGFNSGLEGNIAHQLEQAGVAYEYETIVIRYVRPASHRRYTPDFILPNGIIVETKGRFITDDRQKMKWIREQFPDLDIRLVFSNSRSRINKTSETTYGMWAEKHGFPYADKQIPKEWLHEAPCPRRLGQIDAMRKAK